MNEEPAGTAGLVLSGVRADVVVGALNAIAILLAIAWLWVMVREQQHGGYFAPASDLEVDLSFAERIDVAFLSINVLAYAALVGAAAQIIALLSRRDASR